MGTCNNIVTISHLYNCNASEPGLLPGGTTGVWCHDVIHRVPPGSNFVGTTCSSKQQGTR